MESAGHHVSEIYKAGEQNYADAQLDLGESYYFGRGVPKNYAEAVKWYRKAAEQNSPYAQNNFGQLYAMGEGVPKDRAEAVKWFRKASRTESQQRSAQIGVCYATGEGVPKDDAENYSSLLAEQRQKALKTGKKNGPATMENYMSQERVRGTEELARDFGASKSPPRKSRQLGNRSRSRRAQRLLALMTQKTATSSQTSTVAQNDAQVRLVTASRLIAAKVVQADQPSKPSRIAREGQTKSERGVPSGCESHR